MGGLLKLLQADEIVIEYDCHDFGGLVSSLL